jgi:hypothetical protein
MKNYLNLKEKMMKKSRNKPQVFQTAPSLRPGKTIFNLSHKVLMTADMGYLYPVMVEEMDPGDIWEIGHELFARMMPAVSPLMHEINAYIHSFFVPNRILMPGTGNDDSWEDFITAGVDGDLAPSLPYWDPTDTSEGSLWDYMGMQVGVNPTGFQPVAFPLYAYNACYNEYYRDQNLIDPVDLDDENIKKRAWEKDYLTSALPWQQRNATPPALPITGTGSAIWINEPTLNFAPYVAGDTTPSNTNLQVQTAQNFGYPNPIPISDYISYSGYGNLDDNMSVKLTELNSNIIDFSTASTFDINDLRTTIAVQQWMELNATGGVRYTEYLKAHYNENNGDLTLQRPHFIGAIKVPIRVSEVLQTSSTDGTSPQGNLAGHGIGYGAKKSGRYHAREHGVIISILSIMPRTLYQQGINRQWIKETNLDYFTPEFVNLGEQEVYQGELYCTATESENKTIFGYQGRYNEKRYKPNRVVGQMRDTFDYWHISRQFTSAPLLNQSFVECTPRKDFLSAPSEPAFVLQIGNLVKAIRPIPYNPTPGLYRI